MDSALRSLASEHGSDNGSVSNVSFKSAHTQNTAIARISAMLTESINARKAVFFDLSENDMEPQHELESSSSSSDGQHYSIIHIYVDDYFNSIRDLKNESMLREMEVERRTQERSLKIMLECLKKICLEFMVKMNCITYNSKVLSIHYFRYNHLMDL